MRGGPDPGTRTGAAFAAAGLVALVAGVCGRTLGPAYRWAFDDARFIVKNPHVTSPSDWTAFLTDPRTTDPLSPTGIVRPLRTLEFALDARLFGLEPWGFRLHALLGFAAGAVLLLLLLRTLLGDLRAAFVGAAVWAVHPMQTEAVAWISSRGDVACGALTFGAVLAALRPGRRALAASLACAVLATGFKETGVVVPLLVVLARCVRPPDGVRRGLAAEIVRAWPWFAVSAAYLAYRASVQVGETSHVSTYVLGGSVDGTFATMFRAFGAYVAFALVPVRPALDWFLPASTTLLDPAALAWLVVHGAVLVLGFRWLRSRPPAGAGLLWFYAALLPVANWPWYLGIPTAERFLHVPLAGVAVLVALAFAGAFRVSRSAWHGAAVAVAALGTASSERVADWRDDDALWPATARAVASPRAEGYLAAERRKEGFAALSRGDPAAREILEDGLRHAHGALALWFRIEGTDRPATHVVVEPHVNASNLCVLLGRPGEALFHADEALRIGESLFPQTHYNRALALLDLGRGAAAARAIVRATELGMTPDEEVRRILERAAALSEGDGEIEVARRTLATAGGFPGDGAARSRAALAALDARVVATRDRIAAAPASESGPRLRATVARAVHLAQCGEVALADELVAEVRRAGPPGEALLAAARPAWVHARHAARATPEGWSEAASLLDGSAEPEALFLRARCLEEAGRDAEALASFEAFLRALGPAPAPEDPRIPRARGAVDRLTRPCPEFRKSAFPAHRGSD